MFRIRLMGLLALVCGATVSVRSQAQEPPSGLNDQLPNDYVAAPWFELNDNGAWSWFMDERAIVDRGTLIVGSVRAVGKFGSSPADSPAGNVEVSTLRLADGKVDRVVLHPHFEQDDHNNPAFWVRPDGRYVAVYTKHGQDCVVHVRLSEPGDPLKWGPDRPYTTPGNAGSFSGDSVTYSNVFKFPDGRLYDFHRGVSLDPNYLVSDDDGDSWQYGGRLLQGRDGYSPYLKYAYDGHGKLHFVATEDHPRNFDNSLYHGYLSDGQLYDSNGERLSELSKTTDVSIAAWDFTKLYAGDPDHVAWMSDIELDADGRPCVVFTTQRDGRGLDRGQGGMDMRFHMARFDGEKWRTQEIAYAGTRLYSNEDDYTGLAAIDPDDPTVVYISTDADPKTGGPLVSRADGKRRHELFRGKASADGSAWSWTPLTANSTADNLRPIVPKRSDGQTALVWMRGEYRNNRGEWTTAVAAMPLGKPGDDAQEARAE